LVTGKVKPKAKATGKTTKTASKGAASTVKAKAKVAVKPKAKAIAKAKPAPKVVVKPTAKPAPKVVAKAPLKAPVKPAPVRESRPAPRPPAIVSPKTETRVPGLLSESELMKQPKAEYMSSAQRKFFKHRLLELQKQMRDNADATTEHLRELAVAPDPADRATQEEEHALELRTRDRERKLLKKIESALLRIEDGSYGYCEETGDAIGVPRLLARPTATLTIEAQERRELKQKMYGE
jgi:DnaK suppressor protein